MGSCCGQSGNTPSQRRDYPQQMTGNVTSFALIFPDGSKETFGSRLEADAQNARLGYTGVVQGVVTP